MFFQEAALLDDSQEVIIMHVVENLTPYTFTKLENLSLWVDKTSIQIIIFLFTYSHFEYPPLTFSFYPAGKKNEQLKFRRKKSSLTGFDIQTVLWR